MHAQLENWDWCPENSEYCEAGVVDYFYVRNPRRLPFHPRTTMRFETGRSARAITVTFERPGDDRRIRATQSDGIGRNWALRAPRAVNRRQEIWIVVDYNYERDGRRYGGSYSFSRPVLMHRHR